MELRSVGRVGQPWAYRGELQDCRRRITLKPTAYRNTLPAGQTADVEVLCFRSIKLTHVELIVGSPAGVGGGASCAG